MEVQRGITSPSVALDAPLEGWAIGICGFLMLTMEPRKNNFTATVVAQTLLPAAARRLSPLGKPHGTGVETSLRTPDLVLAN